MTLRYACFGELLLRLGAPGRERLLQSPHLDVHVGGAEANVAIALAHFWHAVRMISAVPDNRLGDAAIGELRRHGVHTSDVVCARGRLGLYFLETGAMQRPSEVLYDRADSVFACYSPDEYDWPTLLADVDVLHLSGVTPALGARPASAAIAAARAARRLGKIVVFDGNFRAKLWQAWDGDPAALLSEILDCANIAFADQRDIGVILRSTFPPGRDGLLVAAQAAFARFPQLERIVCTERAQDSVDHHQLRAHLVTRHDLISAEPYLLDGIVDRIGAGDAFAAGVLHGLACAWDDITCLRFGLAAGCLKHSLPGDAFTLRASAVQALVDGSGLDVRR